MYFKDPFESKYELLINGRVKVEIKQKKKHSLVIHKQLIMSMKVKKTIIQQKKVLIMLDDMITDMEANPKINLIVNCYELFLR